MKKYKKNYEEENLRLIHERNEVPIYLQKLWSDCNI